jgi:hypothetical protein
MGSVQLGRGERLQCWRNVALLRDLAIHGRLLEFVYRLNAADYAGCCAVAHASVGVVSKRQWFEPRRMGSLWFGLVFVCVGLAAAEWPRKRT